LTNWDWTNSKQGVVVLMRQAEMIPGLHSIIADTYLVSHWAKM